MEELFALIQAHQIEAALSRLERLGRAGDVERGRLLAALDALYALEDGMTREQQDRLFALEKALGAAEHGEI